MGEIAAHRNSYITDLECTWKYLENEELTPSVKPAEKCGWFSIFCRLLQTSTPLPSQLAKEKDILISLSQCPFNHEDSTHAQMLFTLYYKLTKLHCPSKTGSHWELVGFQGSDPSTDFRGVGILGLIQPLALSLSETALPFLVEVIEFSQCPTQGFPFMVLSLNVTCIVLNLLRDGYLDRLIRDKNSVFDVVNVYYGAVLFYIYDTWRNENLTLVASGELLKRAEHKCKLNVDQCIKRFESYLETYVKDDHCEEVRLEEVRVNV